MRRITPSPPMQRPASLQCSCCRMQVSDNHKISLKCGCVAHFGCWDQRVNVSKEALLKTVRCGLCWGPFSLQPKRESPEMDALETAMKRVRV